jgi:hypothetical protein
MARSTFGRLFTYARESKADALENFTTEALAAAIRDDPGPIVHLLRRMLLLPSEADPVAVLPSTQVGVPRMGILDLVIDFRYPAGAVELWIELKVMAGESGRQLDKYRDHLASLPADGRPILVTLTRHPIRDLADVPWIPWQSIWRAAGNAPQSSTHWHDLRLFLEEIRMADEFDNPISAREAASLRDAAGLFGKTRRLLAAVAGEANSRWPTFHWPTDERRIQRVMSTQFARHGRLFMVAGEAYRAYLIVGVTDVDGEAHVAFWVETRDKAIEPRRRIIAVADDAGLTANWERDMTSWGGLHRYERLVGFATQADAVEWFIARFEELDSAGILDLIPTLGQAEPEESSEDDVDGAV